MEHEFWHARWERKEIGFHEGTVNYYLREHWPELVKQGNETVFVPLCGKAHDMWWLHDQGHPVIGVELSEIACKDFFEEGQTKAMVRPGQPFTRFIHDSLELWCGDLFQLVPDDLKHVRLVYDRAALIALPPHMRPEYVQHLNAVLPAQAAILLITLDYQNEEMKGPPFNVSDAEVHTLYGQDYEIEHVVTNLLPKDHPFAKRKGLSGASETVFRLRPRHTAASG
ncbi:thiopurine S-methyltransferase [Marinobacter salicampi]|uniref:thiopurine S-methyltransferase n=1 Tax=Marinobacter salicampi TaxID=435907 RepID=UPI001407D31B|nr:thiopurine S-methyltransferase [Marinobacter salicampi]